MTPAFVERGIRLLAVTATALAVVLFAVRFQYAVSLDVPLQISAGGFEEESLFAIWKYLHGEPVFTDPYRIPFAASFFNWLFYGFYGEATRAGLALFGLGEAWIPTVGRYVTAAGALIGLAGGAVLLLKRRRAGDADGAVIGLCLMTVVFVGPLAGFWDFAVRPEIWGLVFDAAALLWYLALAERRPAAAVAGFAAIAFLAWSFKQTYVLAPAGLGLYLLIGRKWRDLTILVAVSFAAYALAVGLAGESYVKTQLIHLGAPFSLPLWGHNLANAAEKSTAAILLGAAALWAGLRDTEARRVLLASPLIGISSLAVAAWAVLILPASAKLGAAENYHLEGMFFLSLAGGAGYTALTPEIRRGAAFAVLHGTGWLLFLGAMIFALSGGARLDLHRYHDRVTAYSACMSDLPQPIFVHDRSAALPWLKPGAPDFVYSYSYELERARGHAFERGGIGGLIADGYFGSLLLPRSTTEAYDGGRLDKYARAPKPCGKLAVYVRRGEAGR